MGCMACVLPEGGTSMTVSDRPPEDCSCLWSSTTSFGSLHIVDDDCPAWPHPRTWRAPTSTVEP